MSCFKVYHYSITDKCDIHYFDLNYKLTFAKPLNVMYIYIHVGTVLVEIYPQNTYLYRTGIVILMLSLAASTPIYNIRHSRHRGIFRLHQYIYTLPMALWTKARVQVLSP